MLFLPCMIVKLIIIAIFVVLASIFRFPPASIANVHNSIGRIHFKTIVSCHTVCLSVCLFVVCQSVCYLSVVCLLSVFLLSQFSSELLVWSLKKWDKKVTNMSISNFNYIFWFVRYANAKRCIIAGVSYLIKTKMFVSHFRSPDVQMLHKAFNKQIKMFNFILIQILDWL